MSEQALTELLPSLGIAAFKRTADGAFLPLAPTPVWFQRITSDTTFPFLGHILEEAVHFWQSAAPGTREWGPCAEVDDEGQEYHYQVVAVQQDGREYLVFQLDTGADRMREVLQKVRTQALTAEQDSASYEAVAAEMRRTNQEVKDLLQQLVQADPTPAQLELINNVAVRCLSLTASAGKLIRATTIPRV